ncbi:ATP-binding protein [Actinoallomurus sp. CA-150999]|uniref:ATP-binding protein n=1 Tax=Actinoallomurus sp. CA-150999 TaxID=3239887 RepID=UPI003D8A7B8E
MRTKARESLRLYPVPSSAGEARRWIKQTLQDHGREEWLDNTTLIVSELVTNAYRHTQRPATLYYSEWECRPWIEVVDESAIFPDFHTVDTLGETGRGLKAVSRLSVICGYCRIESSSFMGKVVFSAPRKDHTSP